MFLLSQSDHSLPKPCLCVFVLSTFFFSRVLIGKTDRPTETKSILWDLRPGQGQQVHPRVDELFTILFGITTLFGTPRAARSTEPTISLPAHLTTHASGALFDAHRLRAPCRHSSLRTPPTRFSTRALHCLLPRAGETKRVLMKALGCAARQY